jgi:hypothetical protein
MLYEYEIRFHKKVKKGTGKTSLLVTLVTSKDEKEVLANKDKVLEYAFAKSGKKGQLDKWEVTNIKTIRTVRD